MPPIEVQLVSIRRSDGGTSILTFIVFSPYDGVRRDPTDANINAAISKGGLDSVSWRRIAAADLPLRDYRDAWTDTGTAITHHMPKAREIHRNKLRRERVPLLADLDIDYQRADEQHDTPGKARIALLKQRLRDVPQDPRIEKAKTIAELSAVKIDARVLGW